MRSRSAVVAGSSDAVRRDDVGAARRSLERAVWVPDLAGALDVQPVLPPGWIAVVRDGSAVVDDIAVRLGSTDAGLERRAEATRLASEVDAAESALATLRAAAAAAESVVADARRALETARATAATTMADRRRAEEAERAAARDAESSAREAAWHVAQRDRLTAELERAREAVPAGADGVGVAGARRRDRDRTASRHAIATWEARVADLRARRDRIAGTLATQEAARRDADGARARAEAAATYAEERVARADRETAAAVERESQLVAERDAIRTEIAAAVAAESAARAALASLHQADAADRARLADAERAASGARERLRVADDRLRATDHVELEARLGLASIRDGVPRRTRGPRRPRLSGARGRAAGGSPQPSRRRWRARATATAMPERPMALAAAFDGVRRSAGPMPSQPVAPSAGRLAALRRRYHELGAANPDAVGDYAELQQRLETLETQGADLRGAIAATRRLIAELDELISTQFRTTFAALETAFERRFEQLFGGGFAKLSLTDPTDLGSTGIEIVARPPGKKPQALAMLSGGERALTAVALLMAMLEVRPVPFCVLDEVDAALDEANIGRFSEALRSLAHQTQFIVITHNRGTIEAADALYGVTVGDDSVSRIISLRLDEAQALASDRRAELAPAG